MITLKVVVILCLVNEYYLKCSNPDLKLKLTIFKESLKNKKFSETRQVPLIERNLTIDASKCKTVTSQFMCPTETVIRIFQDQFPFFMVEQKCLCDRCRMPLVSNENLLRRNTRCKPVTENLPVLIKKGCEWRGALIPRVIGCQCTLSRNINIFYLK